MKGCKARRNIAREKDCNKKAFEFTRDHREKGEFYAKIADALNRYRFEPPQGKKFYSCSIRNLLKLYEKE